MQLEVILCLVASRTLSFQHAGLCCPWLTRAARAALAGPALACGAPSVRNSFRCAFHSIGRAVLDKGVSGDYAHNGRPGKPASSCNLVHN